MLSVKQEFVERDEKRAPLKTPAWEATEELTLLFLGLQTRVL